MKQSEQTVRSTRQERMETMRRTFLESTVRVVAQYGLERTTTKLISTEANLNEAYIYRCFESKEMLLREAFLEEDKRFVQLLRENAAGDAEGTLLLEGAGLSALAVQLGVYPGEGSRLQLLLPLLLLRQLPKICLRRSSQLLPPAAGGNPRQLPAGDESLPIAAPAVCDDADLCRQRRLRRGRQ